MKSWSESEIKKRLNIWSEIESFVRYWQCHAQSPTGHPECSRFGRENVAIWNILTKIYTVAPTSKGIDSLGLTFKKPKRLTKWEKTLTTDIWRRFRTISTIRDEKVNLLYLTTQTCKLTIGNFHILKMHKIKFWSLRISPNRNFLLFEYAKNEFCHNFRVRTFKNCNFLN